MLDIQEAISYFGEVPLLRVAGANDNSSLRPATREASAKALTFCSLFALNKGSLIQLLEMFPSVQKKMTEAAEERTQRYSVSLRAVLKDTASVSRRLHSMVVSRQASSEASPKGDETSQDEASALGEAGQCGLAAALTVAGLSAEAPVCQDSDRGSKGVCEPTLSRSPSELGLTA